MVCVKARTNHMRAEHDAQPNQDALIKDVTEVALVKCLVSATTSTVDVEVTPDMSIMIGTNTKTPVSLTSGDCNLPKRN